MADPTVDPETGKRYDYYKILGLANGWTTEGEAKKAYYKAAMQHHPDKNRDSVEDQERSEVMFKYLQEAWKILSDPSERAYYDRHRSEILAGDVKDEFYGVDTFVNLQGFRTPSCYDKIDDSPRGFYTVYTGCFRALAEEEAKAAQIRIEKGAYTNAEYTPLQNRKDPQYFPPFGPSQASESEVSRFYAWWAAFSSVKQFAHEDVYEARGSSRDRKYAAGENEKCRRDARNRFGERVRGLAAYVKRRDPRVEAFEAAARERDQERWQQQEAEQQRKKAEKKAAAELYRQETRRLRALYDRKRSAALPPPEDAELADLAARHAGFHKMLVAEAEEARRQAKQASISAAPAADKRRRHRPYNHNQTFLRHVTTFQRMRPAEKQALLDEILGQLDQGSIDAGLTLDLLTNKMVCSVCRRNFMTETDFLTHLPTKEHVAALEKAAR